LDKSEHPSFDQGSDMYDALLLKNTYDVELYKYAQILFEQQGKALDFK